VRAARSLIGRGGAPGIALGAAHVYLRRRPSARGAAGESVSPDQLGRLRSAVAAARERTNRLRELAEATLGRLEAEVFDAQQLMLDDPDLLGRAEAILWEEAVSAETALERAGAETAAALRAIPDEYLQSRAADVEDVVARVIDALGGGRARSLPLLERPVVVVADELLPSDTVTLDRDMVLGFVTETGSPTSHAAILARTLGLPAVVGVPLATELIRMGDTVAADGETGEVLVDPDEAAVAAWRERQAAWRDRRGRLRASAQMPAITTDGRRVRVGANIGSPEECDLALANGAEGVGLFRTEFLFMGRDDLPGEDEQAAAYREAIRRLAPHPVVIRTVDAGGDKPVAGLGPGEPEANPFLGVRGIRLALAHEALLLTQLRAVLRAAAPRAGGERPPAPATGASGSPGRGPGEGQEVRVMFPMVSGVGEVRAAKALLARAAAELDARGVPRGGVKVGIMVEVPAAAVLIDRLLPEVDFVSVGTNDLAQYVTAADRTNAGVAHLADAGSPAVLRLVAAVAEAGRRAGKPVAVCGDLAGDARLVPVLVGFGVSELSVAPPLVPEVKQAVRAVSAREAERLAGRVLELTTSEEVREEVTRVGSGGLAADRDGEGSTKDG